MFEDLLISSIKKFLDCNVKLKIDGFMQIDSNVNELKMKLEEDICTLKGSNEFLLSFNINQISNLEVNDKLIQIYIDSDLVILIEKSDIKY